MRFYERGLQQLADTFNLDYKLVADLVSNGDTLRDPVWQREKVESWTRESVRKNILSRIDLDHDHLRNLAKNVPNDSICAALGWWKLGNEWAADETQILAQEQNEGELANLLSAVDVSKLNSIVLDSLKMDIMIMEAHQCLSPALENAFVAIEKKEEKARKRNAKRSKRITEIHKQAEAEPENMNLHVGLLKELAALHAERPGEDTILGKSLTAMTTPPEEFEE